MVYHKARFYNHLFFSSTMTVCKDLQNNPTARFMLMIHASKQSATAAAASVSYDLLSSGHFQH